MVADMTIPDSFIDLIAQVESGGKLDAIGDRKLVNKAYGILQIRQPAVDDFNRWNGTNHTAKEMLNNKELSYTIFRGYMRIYATEARLGRKPTYEDMARIWNGGPMGYLKQSTLPYATKLQKVAAAAEFKLA